MKRMNLDKAAPAVKRFVSELPVAGEGLELEMNGRVVCKILPPTCFSADEMKSMVEERWQLIRKAQRRNKGISPRVLEREVLEAVATVRRRRRP